MRKGAVANNQWHLLTGTYDQSLSSERIKIYYDGVECDVDDGYDEPITDGDEGVYIGRWSTSYFNGTIDEVRIYNRSLSPIEIEELYNNSIPGRNMNLAIQESKELIFSNWNMTSDGGCTNWDDDINNSCNTTDSTPTITVDTSGDVDCRIGKTDVNWLMMGDTRNCSTTGGTSHICTLNETDSLSSGNQFIYINCNKDQGTEVNSGGLNITYLV